MGARARRLRRNRPGRHRRSGEPLVEHIEHEPEAPARRFSLPAPSPSSLVGIAVLVLIGAGAVHLGSSGSAVPLEEPAPTTASSAPAEEAASTGAAAPAEQTRPSAPVDAEPTATASTIIVHVSGAVAQPGVVRLDPGARVQDAVDAAGGPTAKADLAAVNLARPLTDGEQVHLPVPGEDPPVVAPESAAPGSEGSSSSDDNGSGDGADGALIDINTASAAELEELPGVGPAIAQRIIDHREANGPFRSVDDLVDVSGIGPATLEKIREHATVNG